MESTGLAAVDVVARLATPENFGMSAALWLGLDLARRLLPKVFAHTSLKMVTPVLPETLGALMYVFIPALAAQGATLGERLLVGIVVGTGSSKVHAVIKRLKLGKEIIVANRKSKAVSAESATEPSDPAAPPVEPGK